MTTTARMLRARGQYARYSRSDHLGDEVKAAEARAELETAKLLVAITHALPMLNMRQRTEAANLLLHGASTGSD